jgi:hypothetical protein
VTSVVWLIQVMDGLDTVMASPTAPSAASRRRLGTGSAGSFQSHEGNPSMDKSTTMRCFAVNILSMEVCVQAHESQQSWKEGVFHKCMVEVMGMGGTRCAFQSVVVALL